ncbi:MAG: hypothetical protein WBJ10_12940 [Daejeonella sp.]|uniref:hypothetical protein n=1 Tax=Daejeonella sp. TaxID=2805397 RepID=UPI003C7640C7
MRLIQKVIILVLIVLFVGPQAYSNLIIDDEKELTSLADGFALAMSKKDKEWMETNLTGECMTYMPTGESINKQSTIQAFTGAVYDIKKSSVGNKSFGITEMEAIGSADYTVEGSVSGGDDISGTYKLSFKFKKTDAGWKISEIQINGQ